MVNPLEEDPYVYIEKSEIKESYLFDCGIRVRGNYRKIKRLWGICISHAHIDHFVGFDHMIRSLLSDDKEIHIFGPRGIIDKIQGKLTAYDWDRAYDQNLILYVTELRESVSFRQTFVCKNQFKSAQLESFPTPQYIRKTDADEVRFAFADHGGSPCLAFALRINDRWKVNKDKLQALHLDDGPWVGKLLASKKNNTALESSIIINDVTYSSEFLTHELLYSSPGSKIAYVTDTRVDSSVRSGILQLVERADILVCEGTFLTQDIDCARQFHHLTAIEAAEFALEAQVQRLILNHPSRRYHGMYRQLLKEARSVFPNTELVPYKGGLFTL